MAMEQRRGKAPMADRRPQSLVRAGLTLACLLLASGAVCWVAANWPHASAMQKLAGVQLLLVALVLAAVWHAGRHCKQLATQAGAGNHNFSTAAHLAALAGVACGVLLALIGQIYQTGADAWQLFLVWAVLLIPWTLAMRTVFLGLLFAAVLNTAFALLLDTHAGGVLPRFGGWAGSALFLALLNAALLALCERFEASFGDAWRLGPRALATAAAAWLLLAAFAGIDSPTGPIVYSVVGWAALAIMYLIYTRWRTDLLIVSLAALAAFILLVLPLLYWVGSKAGLLLVVVVLLIAMAVGLRKLGNLIRARALKADPWYVSAFRLVAMGITAVLLLVFVLITLEFEVASLWVPGLVLCVVGLAAYRLSAADIPRELGLTLMTAGLLLSGGSFFALHEEGSRVAVYCVPLLGAAVYASAANAAFRFIAAFFTLGMLTIMTWPHGAWENALFDDGYVVSQAPLSVYLRMWWFSMAAVLALLFSRGEHAGKRWRPLGWALVFLAQIIVWNIPALQFDAHSAISGEGVSVLLIWLACAALPVVALAAVLWRRPVLPMTIRLGAPLALAIAAAGWMGAPGVSLALLWLIVGFAMNHRSLMGFGVLAMLAYLMRFYYQLDTSLLQKSFVLMATGAWLLAAVWALKRASRAATESTPTESLDESQSLSADTARAHEDARHEIGQGAAAAASRRDVVLGRAGLITGLLIILIVANVGIYQREQILSDGRTVILELAPVDPRSLMQGDYMRLSFEVASQAQTFLRQAPESIRQSIERRRAGWLLLRPDKQGVHRLVALMPDHETAGRPANDVGQEDVLLKFRLRNGRMRVVTDAWFFPEGQASHYEQAHYGEFRVDDDGAGLLTGLLDTDLRSLSAR